MCVCVLDCVHVSRHGSVHVRANKRVCVHACKNLGVCMCTYEGTYLGVYMQRCVFACVPVSVCCTRAHVYAECMQRASVQIAPVFGASSRVRDKIGADPRD